MTSGNRKVWAFVVLLAWLTGTVTAHAADVNVRGRTVAENGAPIAGVTVQAFRHGEAGMPATSNAQGEYVVGLTSGDAITRIEYRHSAFDLADIAFVSGSDSQQRIVKVMYQKGQARSVSAIVDTLSAYEQFALNAFIASRENRQRAASLSKELDLQSKLTQLPIKSGNAFVDSFLERRRKELITLLVQL